MDLLDKLYRFCFYLLTVTCFTCCKDEGIPVELPQNNFNHTSINEINANLLALEQLIDKVSNEEPAELCTPLANERGYNIQFQDGKTVTLLTMLSPLAEDATLSGYSPMLTARKEDAHYYWCLDGKWLHSETNNNKIQIGGNSTPRVAITPDGFWCIQLDDKTLKLEQKATAVKSKSAFRHIEIQEGKQIKIYMQGESSPLVIPMQKADEPTPEPSTGSMRRPISATQPAWLIHIDTWNTADPQKIIDLIPQDIRPYVIFNISLSISHNEDTGVWNLVEYGYETAKSWLRTCAENQVWAMVQPSSGGFAHFPDFSSYDEMESSVYEEFFRNYPNFLGFNYCEQFWGFDDVYSVSFKQRLRHFAQLLKLSHQYGGYLVVSCCGPYWGAAHNPIGMLKQDAELAQLCRTHPEHFILCEKYTSKHGFYDIESTCLGTWLSGYAGQYGIRFDECGWNGHNGDESFPVAAGAIPIIEHVALTGQTVIDGPELIWQQCFKEVSTIQSDNGYSARSWQMFPQFRYISIDLFRKIIDGTIRIMPRQEVIERSKVVILQDRYSGNSHDLYCAPLTLYEGLYRMDGDGNLGDNHNYFKQSGRYPTIPVAWQLADDVAGGFAQTINHSTYDAHWPTIADKVRQFNLWFPQQSTGTLYVGRQYNTLVTYNPSDRPDALIPFQYNTAEQLELSYHKYTVGVIREYSDHLTLYLNNYDPQDNTPRKEVIKIHGCTSRPTFSYDDRGAVTARLNAQWDEADGLFTLEMQHNGPLDITIRCQGSATNRQSYYPTSTLTLPTAPQPYSGALQYEAEHFDWQHARVVKNGVGSSIRHYTGMGYVQFGNQNGAALRCRTVQATTASSHQLHIRYQSIGGSASGLQLHVNGQLLSTFTLPLTPMDSWQTFTLPIQLHTAANTIELRAPQGVSSMLYIDNFVIDYHEE